MQTDEPGDTEQPQENLDQPIEDVAQAFQPEAEADSSPDAVDQASQPEAEADSSPDAVDQAFQPEAEADSPPDAVDQASQPEAEADSSPDAVDQAFQPEAEADSSPEDITQPEKVELQAEPPRRLSRAERETYERRRRRFAACGRCGYFLADCRIYLGEEAIQTAFLASEDDWMRLEGDLTFHRLLRDAYGVELEAGYDYFDGSCPECRRRFVCDTLEDGATRLKIHV